MTLSVLTLVKNREAHLAKLVEGLNRSSSKAHELVIIDMSDAPVAQTDSNIPTAIIRLECDGLPLAKARNLAAHHASGDLLLFLDVDCIPGHRLVADMSEALRAHDALICSGIGYLAAGDVQSSWCEQDLAHKARPHPVRDFTHQGLKREFNAGLFWSLAFGIRKAAFCAIEGFDENFSGYGAEDTDFGFRSRNAGMPLLFMGGTNAYHQHHEVFDPPLQHFDDIVRNARVFHRLWNFWPMDGWLNKFETMGLISRTSSTISLHRSPTQRELDHARISNRNF